MPVKGGLLDPHVKERGFRGEVACAQTGPIVAGNPTQGTHLYPGPVFDMSKTPLRIRRPAPTLGQHNEYVYKELLGFSDEEYQRLVAEGHIGDTYLAALPERAQA